jgi:hypothetical protein
MEGREGGEDREEKGGREGRDERVVEGKGREEEGKG